MQVCYCQRVIALSGLISEINLDALHTVTGAVGLKRLAVGMEDVQNPPAGLFEGDFYYAWQRIEDSDRFEMNLEIPVGDEVKHESLWDLAEKLRANPPTDRNDERCQVFDCAVDRLLRWFVALIQVDYQHIGLINPENILILRWDGWREGRSGEMNVGSPEPRNTRVVLSDAGFIWRPGGALPDWLGDENRWKFIWGDKPENIYRRTFNSDWYLRALARLLAFVLEPTCGVESPRGGIEPTALARLPMIADAWKVLDEAINGQLSAATNDENAAARIDAFRLQLAEKKASLHFLLREDTIPPRPPSRPPPPPSKSSVFKKAVSGFVILIALLLVALLYLQSTRCGPAFGCCPDVKAASPIAKQLKDLDALRGEHWHAWADGDNVVIAGSVGKKNTKDRSLPLRITDAPTELFLILAVKKAYDDAGKISLEDTECVESLVSDYCERLGNETKLAHRLLKGSVGTGGITALCEIQQDIQTLQDAGEEVTGNWLNLYRALVRRNRLVMQRECEKIQGVTPSAATQGNE